MGVAVGSTVGDGDATVVEGDEVGSPAPDGPDGLGV